MSSNNIILEKGSDDWRKWRKLATQSIPGKRSALYILNKNILGMGDLVPMTYRAHWAMCLFAEGATGIPAIDDARIKLILVPRGVGKSALITKGKPILNLLRYDDWSVGIANEKADLAEAFLAAIKSEFETNTLLQTLFPERIPNFRDTTWKTDRIVIARKKANPMSPSVLATGVGGSVTGVHMHEWLADDLLSQDAAEAAYRGSFNEIEKVNRWLVRLQPLLKSPKEDPITIIGTKWWEGDTYEFAEKHWGHGEEPTPYEWVLTLPDGTVQTLSLYRRGEVAVFKRPIFDNGHSFFPERLPDDKLAVMQQEDPVFFAGQYLLEPAAGGASEFNLDWLKEFEWDGAHTLYFQNEYGRTEYARTQDMALALSVDPAFSDNHSAARSALPLVGVYGNRKFLLEDYAERGLSVDGIAHKVIDFIQRYKPRKIFVETIVAQVAVADAIRRIARDRGLPEPPIEEIRSHGRQRKDMRIYGLEPYFKRGEFYVHRSHTNFKTEYMSFPRGQLRDILDALSFQRDFWERMSPITGHDPQGKTNSTHEHDKRALERLRAAVGPHGGY